MGSRRDCTWILGLAGFRVVTIESDGETADSRLTIRIERRGIRRLRVQWVWSTDESRAIGARADLGRSAVGVASGHAGLCAAARPVSPLRDSHRADRVRRCRRRGSRGGCGSRLAWTVSRCRRRMRRCATASVGAKPVARRRPSCASGTATRPKRRPRHLGADEIHRGKAQKFYTVLSDLVHGEVIGLAQDRTEDELGGLADDVPRRAAARGGRGRLHRHASAVPERGGARELPKAEIVFDKFHVLQHAGGGARRRAAPGVLSRRRRDAGVRPRQALAAAAAVEDGARLEARRAAAALCGQSAVVQGLRAARATRSPVDLQDPRRRGATFSGAGSKALRWQRLPEMEKLGDTLVNHFDGIAAYCDHPVRFGVVESLNTTIKAVLRRARGMRDDAMLLLKLKWATAHPIRSARDLARFLSPQGLYSNR